MRVPSPAAKTIAQSKRFSPAASQALILTSVFLAIAPPPGIDPGPWASKAHVLATTQWRNPYSPSSEGLLLTINLAHSEIS